MNAQYVVYSADSQALAAQNMHCLSVLTNRHPRLHRSDNTDFLPELLVNCSQTASGNTECWFSLLYRPNRRKFTYFS